MHVVLRKWLALFGLILLTACSSNSSADFRTSSFILPNSVDVIFNVSVPNQTGADKAILFVLLDPVTGLEANPQYFEMTENGDKTFSVSLSVTPGSLLYYRYAMRGQSLVTEKNAFGDTVDYRLYLVDGPDHSANDFVISWEELSLAPPSGRLLGSIVDTGSGAALSGIQVCAGGLRTQTDIEGHFSLDGLPEGLHTLVAFSEDGSYLPFQQGAIIATDADTPAEVQLSSVPMVEVTFNVNLPEDSVPGVPIHMAGNLPQFAEAGSLSPLGEGNSSITISLPAQSDIRYKYTLGDGYWNGEQNPESGFLLRQLILPKGTESLKINDQIFGWAMDSSSPIWFDLVATNLDGKSAYIQFKLADWAPALAMWPLGDGHFAYKLYNPTNFASPLEYRYCIDSGCSRPEQGSAVRFATGNLDSVLILEDQVQAWGE